MKLRNLLKRLNSELVNVYFIHEYCNTQCEDGKWNNCPVWKEECKECPDDCKYRDSKKMHMHLFNGNANDCPYSYANMKIESVYASIVKENRKDKLVINICVEG